MCSFQCRLISHLLIILICMPHLDIKTDTRVNFIRYYCAVDIFRIHLELGIHAIKNRFEFFLLNNSSFLMYTDVYIPCFSMYFVYIFLLQKFV